MDIMQQLMQLMGMGEPAPAAKPPVRGYYGNQEELLPDYATGGHGPSLVNDPAFQKAVGAFTQMYGHEPATDSDFAEVQSMMVSGDTSRQATEQEVLRTVTGTRGSPATGPVGDDENLPPSDARILDADDTTPQPFNPDLEIDEFTDFVNERRALWEADETGSEGGFDVQTLEEAEDGFGASLWEMPAEEIMPMLMRDVSKEEADYWQTLTPEQRREIAYEIANSDGLGSISSFMNGR